MNDIIEFIRETLAELLKIDPTVIEADSDLLYDLGVDSLDVVELMMAIEERYDYYLPDAELIKLRTVGDIADNIGQATAKK